MEYIKIISVSGLSGLYELLTSKSDGAIVRSLEDKSTKFVSSRVHNFSHLESIEVYTVRDNVNLVEVFNAMDQSSEKVPDGSDAAKLKAYFEKVYPDLDFERVYTSDLKKMVKWLAILKANDVEIKLPEPEPEEELVETGNEEPVEEKAVAKKSAASDKKTPKDKEVKEPGEKPAPKKAPAKKETEEKKPPVKKAATKAAKKETKEEKEDAKKVPAKKAAPKKKASK